MPLKVELSVLIEEGPGVGAVLLVLGDARAEVGLLIIQVGVAVLQVEDRVLRVHAGDDQVCNQVLLQVLVKEEVAYLQEIKYVHCVHMGRAAVGRAGDLAAVVVVEEHSQGLGVHPLGHDQPLPVGALDLILILVHVLVLLDCLLEIITGRCEHDLVTWVLLSS